MESPVAIVTSGAQGIGAAICVSLLKAGYRVCVADIGVQAGKQFVTEQQKKHGSEKVKFTACDVSKEEDFKGLFDFALKAFKRLDLVVNNAGIAYEGNPRKTLDVNLLGPIIGCQLAIQYMSKANEGNGGMVINIASLSGVREFPQCPVYAASKHGVVGLTRSYGVPYYMERDGILFAALCPSFVDTSLIRGLRIMGNLPSDAPISITTMLTPEDVAEAVLKLLQDRINGSIFIITKEEGSGYVDYPKDVLKYPKN